MVLHSSIRGLLTGDFLGLLFPVIGGNRADRTEQVGAEPRVRSVAPADRGNHLGEGFMCHIIGVRPVTRQTPGEPEGGVVVPAVQDVDGVAISGTGGDDQGLIRSLRIRILCCAVKADSVPPLCHCLDPGRLTESSPPFNGKAAGS